MSHIDSRLTLALTVTRGRRAPFTVEPLPDGPPQITAETVAEFEQRITDAATVDELKNIGADLKSWDLGTHREHLLSMWSDRKKAIEATS
ncbi:hypothetical protein [Mycobacterium sp. 48b]|uniref:hypothetical protein n=1 Tax=Mycobacterium sp. 48b TaxID=3400426 RepID=UPI003AABAD12